MCAARGIRPKLIEADTAESMLQFRHAILLKDEAVSTHALIFVRVFGVLLSMMLPGFAASIYRLWEFNHGEHWAHREFASLRIIWLLSAWHRGCLWSWLDQGGPLYA